MQGFSQSEEPLRPERPQQPIAGADLTASGAAGDARGQPELEEPELDAALQLLVERAQYITGATGTALALPHGDEMVCRASTGSCAPAVGARLQVRSGLTGESLARRQLLRCDNAEADPRVNLEACRALGIASIVVLPMLRRNGEVRGLFELFSDHPYAFEERDLIALERMADLTLTALDLAEQRHGAVPPPPREKDRSARPATAGFAAAGSASTGFAPAVSPPVPASAVPVVSVSSPPQPAKVEAVAIPAAPIPSVILKSPLPEFAPIPESPHDESASHSEAALHVQKCAACGFPVSEGRTLCLDCDQLDRERRALAKLNREKRESERKQAEAERGKISQAETSQPETALPENENSPATEPSSSMALAADEIPPFLANSLDVKRSWLADHINLLAIIVLALGILVAVVVFR